MVDVLGVEFNGSEGCLHDGAGGEGTDKGADADRASEEPADKGCKAKKRDAHGADIGPDCKVYSKSINKQTDSCNDHIKQNISAGAILL